MPRMQNFTADEVQAAGYNDPVHGFDAYMTDLKRIAGDPDYYGGSYLGEGDDPQWAQHQADMGKAMAVCTNYTGRTYLYTIGYNCFHHHEALLALPAVITMTTVIPADSDAAFIEATTRRYEHNKYDGDVTFSRSNLYGHPLNDANGHSGMSQSCCAVAVMQLALKLIGGLPAYN